LREDTGGGGCTTGAGVGVGGAVWTVGWRAAGGCYRNRKLSEYVKFGQEGRTSCAGTESAISMSAGAESPFARGVDSGSTVGSAGLGDDSAIVVTVRSDEFSGTIDTSRSAKIVRLWCVDWSRLEVVEASLELIFGDGAEIAG
jgi:hypothetical protein